jgi:hypothetical protein
VQKKFIRYSLRRLGWADMNDLPPYESRCMLLNVDTLQKRRTIACVMFVRDVLCARIESSNLLMKVRIAAGHYRTRTRLNHMLYIDTHRTNYGANEPFNAAQASFNLNSHVFVFNIARERFKALLRSAV